MTQQSIQVGENEDVHSYLLNHHTKAPVRSHEWSVSILGVIYIILTCMPLFISLILVYTSTFSSTPNTANILVSWGFVIYFILSILSCIMCMIGSKKHIILLLSIGNFILCVFVAIQLVTGILAIMILAVEIFGDDFDYSFIAVPVVGFLRIIASVFLVVFSLKRLNYLRKQKESNPTSEYELEESKISYVL